MTRFFFVFACSILLPLHALAAPGGAGRPIKGGKIDLRDSEEPRKRRATFKTTKETAIDVATLPDPRRSGATLRIVGSGPGFGDSGDIPLDLGLWHGIGRPAGSKGYLFSDRDATNGVRKVQLKFGRYGGSLAISAGKENWPLTLPKPQSEIAVRLAIDGVTYCARFGPETITHSEDDRFRARNAPALASCTPGRCGDGTVDPGEECDDGNLIDGDCCSSACLHEADGSPCDDGLYCTATDTCSAGTCVGDGNVCDDGVDCTVDRCDEERESCSNDTHDAFCDDFLACNGTETCDRLAGCTPGVAPDPDCTHLDGPCTLGVCDQRTGGCKVELLDEEGCPSDEPQDGESAGSLPLAIEWLDDLSGGPLQVRRLTALIANTTDEPVEASLSAIGSGLDLRTAETTIRRSLRVYPGKPRKLSLSLRYIPVQSVGSLSSFTLLATIQRDDGHSVVVPSDPVFLDFDESYRMATLHAADSAHVELGRDDIASVDNFAERLASIVETLFDQAGRVLATIDGRTRLVDVADLRAQETDIDLRPAGSVVVKAGDFGGGTTTPNIPGYIDGFDPIDFPSEAPLVRICSHWRGLWVDAGFGEDYLTSKGTNDVPARYAQVRIGRGERELIYSGYLDSTGCVQLHLEPGDYYMMQLPHMKIGDVEVHIDYQEKTEGRCNTNNEPCDVASDCSGGAILFCSQVTIPDYTNFTVIGFTVPNPLTPLSPNPNIFPTWHDDLTRVTGVMAQIMATPDSGIDGDPDQDYFVHADQNCEINGEAVGGCAQGKNLYIGKRPNGAAGELANSLWKGVIAHEFGHSQQLVSMIRPPLVATDYTAVDPAEAACNCSHVASANSFHCLQSLELGHAAEIEGWAQFYAAKAFNDPTENDCTFVYYKEFRDPSGAVLPVPNVHDCRTPKQWWRTHCYYPPETHVGFDLGTELDWMLFYWNVNTVGPYSSSMYDLANIWNDACLGDGCSTWVDLASESVEYYGLTLEADHFITSGENAGIHP